jgi:CBS domain-containing protein
MQTGYKVMDVMTNKPVIAPKDMILTDAANLLIKEDVNSLLLVEDNKPVGIVTDEDIVRKCVARGLDSKKLKLKDIAIVDLITITADNDIYDALTLMGEHNIRQLPVVDKKNQLVGFVTVKGILKIQPDLIDTWMEKYEVREESRHMEELEDMAKDDGSEGFFSKLRLRKKNNSNIKKNVIKRR